MICAASFARERGDEATAKYLEEYADFLECHVESWTVTTHGTLLPGVARHYLRILPERPDNPNPDEDPNHGNITIANRRPGARNVFPAKEVVDAGFLELVRHGVRRPDDPIIVDSLKVVDAVLKVDTPFGPCWRRYNHDGYGQRDDGGPFVGWGRGRAWPLLTGERGHYELAAGHDTKPFLRAMEGLASSTGLLPEQASDGPDQPQVHMYRGRPTGSAMPLMWAHAEYVKLLHSVRDGKVFDLIAEVAKRYLGGGADRQLFEVWKFTRQARSVRCGYVLRIQVPASFRLRWSGDEWHTVKDTPSSTTTLGVEFVDIPIIAAQRAPIRFTFFWTANDNWEGRDFMVSVI
jgi:glucoamylase